MKKLLLILIIVLFTAPVYGADYYVATDGDNSASGTILAPWLTIQYSVNTISAGDTINIRTGTYYERISGVPSGSTSGQTIIQAYDGEEVIVDGSDSETGWVSAPEVGSALVFKKTLGYEPTAITADGIYNVDRIDTTSMSLTGGESNSGFTNLSYAYDATYSFTKKGVEWASVRRWDSIGAKFGYKDGVTYIRFGDGDDPDLHNIRAFPATSSAFNQYPRGAVFNLSTTSYATIKDLIIRGGRYAIEMDTANSHHNVIDGNTMMHGNGRVTISNGAYSNTISNNTMYNNHFTYTSYVPGPFESALTKDDYTTDERYAMGMGAYFQFHRKELGGETVESEGDCGIKFEIAGSNNVVSNNTIYNGAVGVTVEDTDDVTINDNTIYNMSAQAVWIRTEVDNLRVHNNLLYNINSLVRMQKIDYGNRLVYYYENNSWNILGQGQHFYFHFDTDAATPTTPAYIYIYHNNFSGAGDIFDGGETPDSDIDILVVRAVNNIFSSYQLYTSYLATRLLTYGYIDYNWLGGANPYTTPDVPANLDHEDSYYWDGSTMPTFQISPVSDVITAGQDISTTWGNSYSALPGFDSGYFTGSAPNIGNNEYISSDSIEPKNPTSLTVE